MKLNILSYLLIIFTLMSCLPEQTNNEMIITPENKTTVQEIQLDTLQQTNKVYVPVYSTIYQRTKNDRTSLTSTMSIHNTSETDTLFISRVDYYNTQGELVEKYLKKPIYLTGFETIEYVVDEKNVSGGSGANFVIEWYGAEKLNPLFQAVMIGGLGNKSFSFTTEGVPFK